MLKHICQGDGGEVGGTNGPLLRYFSYIIFICRTMNYEQTLLSLFFSFNDKSAASGFMSTNTQDFQIRYLEFKRQHKGIKNPPLP